LTDDEEFLAILRLLYGEFNFVNDQEINALSQ